MTNISKKLKKTFQYIREYGLKCFIGVYLSNFYSYSKHKNNVSWLLLQYKHSVIKDYMLVNYYSKADQIIKTNQELNADCIWTAWIQGEENAPEIVRLSLASIRKSSNGHRLIVLTDNNIGDFIELPGKIVQKHNDGIIGNAHYVDIIRMMVLKKYGGIWFDATMILHEPVSERAFVDPFFSFGFQENERSNFVSDHKWIVGIMGGYKNSLFLAQISNMLTKYWEEHDVCIDYFVFDYLIATLYQNNQRFAEQIKSLPCMKYNINKLTEIIDKPYLPETLNRYMIPNQIYRLTYKRNYQRIINDNQQTVYGYLCDQLLNGCDNEYTNPKNIL